MAYKPGRCLLHLRLKQAGMTPQSLADKLGMDRQQVSNYANKVKVMSLSTAKTIATAIGCSIEDLYEWEYTPKRKKE